MTQTYNEDVVINDNLQVNGASDEVQVTVTGASTQTEALQQWKGNSGSVLSEIDESGHLIVGSQDGTIDALIEAHNIEDTTKPSRGLHSKGILTGTLSNLVSWVVNELGLKGTGGLSALHRALRVQVTNENTGEMASGADVRAGDFEAINIGGNGTTNNLEMSALVAKVNNQSGANLDKMYGLKVEMVDDGSSNEIYAIHTDTGKVYFGDVLELADNAGRAPLNITPRTTAPTSAEINDLYLHQINPGEYVWRRYTGSAWEDVGASSSGGGGLYDAYAIIRDEKSTGTAGGSSSGTTWNARDLNTELVDDDGIVTISSNKFTPVNGTFHLSAFAPCHRSSVNRLRLYNVTAGTSVEEGAATNSTVNATTTSVLNCEFTANGTDEYRIDNYTDNGRTTNGLGVAANDGSPEVYLSITLRRKA